MLLFTKKSLFLDLYTLPYNYYSLGVSSQIIFRTSNSCRCCYLIIFNKYD